MIVKLIKNITPEGCELNLTLGRHYEVLGIEGNDYRILADEDSISFPNEPFLYDPGCFQVVDSCEPPFWLVELGQQNEKYAYPEEWASVGFFEDYHDGVEPVRKQFWDVLRRLYPKTWSERRASS